METAVTGGWGAVRERLDGVRRTLRSLYVRDGVTRLVFAVGGFILSTFILDYLLVLPSGVRLVFLAGGLAGFGFLLATRVLRRLRLPITDTDLAVFAERNFPELNDRLISAIQFSREEGGDDAFNSPVLVGELLREAEEAVASVDFERMIERREIRKRVWLATGTVAGLLLLGGLFFEYSSIYLQRAVGANVRWPQRIELEVIGFTGQRLAVAKGDDVTIAVQAKRKRAGASLPSSLRIFYRFDSGESAEAEMRSSGKGQYKYEFPSVTGGFVFRVRGAEEETDEHRVEVMTPPALEAIHVFYTYPKYLHRSDTPPERPETSGVVTAPFHTVVRFSAWTTGPVSEAQFLRSVAGKQDAPVSLEIRPDGAGVPRRVDGEFEVTEERGEYRLVFTSVNGLSNATRDPIVRPIRGQRDRAPEIVVNDPTGHEDISEVCVRPFQLTVRDDFGVREIALEYRVTGSRELDWKTILFAREQNRGLEYGAAELRPLFEPGLDVAKLGVKPGDYVVVRFVARDYKDIGAPNETRSPEFRFPVISLAELQKRLEQEIEKIKGEIDKLGKLEDQYARQVGGILKNDRESLDAAEVGRLRDLAQEQTGITGRIDAARRGIERVRRRGVYNRVFDEGTARELVNAEGALEPLVGTKEEAGSSPLATSVLLTASKARDRESRRTALREAQNRQNEVVEGLRVALLHLQRWSTYQEIIRMTRQIWEMQHGVNEGLKGK